VIPSDTGVTTPEASIVAMPVLEDVHEPSATVLLSVVVEPIHKTAVPPIAAGEGLTEIVTVAAAEPEV
jgi:hypothetical protein